MADETVEVGEATGLGQQEDTNPIPKVTRPARKRASGAVGGGTTSVVTRTKAQPATSKAKPAAVKVAAPATVEPAPTPVAAPVDDGLVRTVLEFTYFGDTKSYSVFQPPEGSGCVGKVYAPLGTTNVRVLLVQPAE